MPTERGRPGGPPEPTEFPGAMDWDRRLGFSEIYLHILPRQHREVFRQFARMLLDLEPGARWAEGTESRVRESLEAARADLRVVQGFLAELGESARDPALGKPDRALAELAGILGKAAGQIADAISWGLDGPEPSRSTPDS